MTGVLEAEATLTKTRILILGGGFGGAYCAQHLERLLWWRPALRRRVEITLIDRHNYFLFSPLLVEAGTGALQPSHAVVGLRRFCRRTAFVQAEITGIDLAAREITYFIVGESEPVCATFDHCVLSMGSATLKPPVPGLKAHGYEMKTLTDAIALRDRAVQLLEQASAIDDADKRRALLHLTVVGGSFTGIEVAGEYFDYMRAAAKFYPRLDPADVRVTIINRGESLLGELDPRLGDWALRHLRRQGIEVLLETTATAVHADSVELQDGRRLPARTVVWCAGIQPNASVKLFEVPTDERGYILCERDLRVKGEESVWALGDAAVNPTATGRAYPATAQAAVQQAKICARNIVLMLEGEPTEAAEFADRGMLVAFGKGDAVAQVLGMRLVGWPAWWLWRTVYLMKMPGLGRKLRIAIDWTLDLFSGRDFVELGVHRVVKHDAAARPEEEPQISQMNTD